ncbi:cytochrome P450 4F2-like [Physella acuta]|uniref:cytochrome P450 4F2-like n=1 Tax=Physella acuta TaxID=109671 RepID=UPI0027DC6C09|nr:cytochrome P450 4F2-like [Physella acuta]XP_059138468.1 cytochrome P450 4F2-like [Physella acuta]
MATLTGYLAGAVMTVVTIGLGVKVMSAILSHRRRVDAMRRFPQDPTHPFFGHLLHYAGPNEKGLAFLRSWTEKFPRIFVGWLFYLPLVIVNHPDTLRVILKSPGLKAKRFYNFIQPYIGEGLFRSEGERWARNRRVLTTALHARALRNYVELKNRCTDTLLIKFQQAAETSQPLKAFVNITMFSFDVILRCAMSYQTDCQIEGLSHPYVEAVDSIVALIVRRFFRPWLHNDFIYFLTSEGRRFKQKCNFVHGVADFIIKSRREKLKTEDPTDTEGKRHMDLLDILLTATDEDGVGMTDVEIRDEVNSFLLAGHDATASAISWTLYSIAKHGDVQQKVCQEIDELMADRSCTDILWEDLSQLPYLTMVMKESLRLHSIAPFIHRQMTCDTRVDDLVVPAGTEVSLSLYNTHHNPQVWEDSMKFDPNRFLPENSEKRNPYAFVPFSAGPRNCVGQNFALNEMKIVLARILYRFNIKLDPSHTVEKVHALVMQPTDDINLLVTSWR